jgi:hypothetical protein
VIGAEHPLGVVSPAGQQIADLFVGYTLTTPFAAARLWLIHDPKSIRSSWHSRPKGH